MNDTHRLSDEEFALAMRRKRGLPDPEPPPLSTPIARFGEKILALKDGTCLFLWRNRDGSVDVANDVRDAILEVPRGSTWRREQEPPFGNIASIGVSAGGDVVEVIEDLGGPSPSNLWKHVTLVRELSDRTVEMQFRPTLQGNSDVSFTAYRFDDRSISVVYDNTNEQLILMEPGQQHVCHLDALSVEVQFSYDADGNNFRIDEHWADGRTFNQNAKLEAR